MTRAGTLIVVIALVVLASTFYVWAIGRAVDHEGKCATVSGQCDVP